MWDVLATNYLSIPEAITFEDAEIEIDIKGGNAGRTYRIENSGNKVKIATKVNNVQFYNFLFDSFTATS